MELCLAKWNLWIPLESLKANKEVVSEDITDKTDDIVVRRLSYGSNAFNNSHTALLNNYGEGDEVSELSNDDLKLMDRFIDFQARDNDVKAIWWTAVLTLQLELMMTSIWWTAVWLYS